MASANYMLAAMCRSVSGGWEIDVRITKPRTRTHLLSDGERSRHSSAPHRVFSQACWASFVLIVYLCCDPRGRPLLAETGLTDLDVQTACAFEAYGRGEITRRARLRASQEEEARKASEKAAKKRKKDGDPGQSSAPSRPPPPPADNSEDEFEPEIDPETGLVIEDDTASIVNDDDGESDDDGVPDMALAAAVGDPIDTERADQKVLATKRKRASKGYANASTADAHGVISWYALLTNLALEPGPYHVPMPSGDDWPPVLTGGTARCAPRTSRCSRRSSQPPSPTRATRRRRRSRRRRRARASQPTA